MLAVPEKTAVKFRAVIFDLFGTLVDNMSLKEYEDMMDAMAAVLGAPCDRFRRAWTGTVDDRMNGAFPTIEANLLGICLDLGIGPGSGKVSAAAGIRIAVSGGLIKPRPDALETLETIRGRGMKTALITDCTPEVPCHVGRSPFASRFDAMVFSAEVRMKKPDPRIYGIACAKLAVEPAGCLYVGDGGSGELTGAGKLGMTPLRINAQSIEYSLGHKSEAATWPGPTVRSLKEVLEYC